MGGNGCPQREITRLALHVIRGENLWTTAGHVADTQVIISLIKDDATVAFKTSSRVVRAESSPEWQLSSVMDLPHPQPLTCTVQIEVVKVPPLKIGFRRSMCVFSSDLSSLLDQAKLMPNATSDKDDDVESVTTALSEPFWLDCQHRGHRRGRLLVQAQYLNRIEAKPIRILVLTWNMGNAPPSPAFSSCFPDSEMGAYDLIVVGTQESAFNAPSRLSMTSAAAQMLPSAPPVCIGVSPEASVISDGLTDTGRIPDTEGDGEDCGVGGYESGAVGGAGEITPFYLDESPEPSQSLLSESNSDWRSAQSANSGHSGNSGNSSDFTLHGEVLSAGALSEGVEVVSATGPGWPTGVPGRSRELDQVWSDAGLLLPPLASGARSAYVDEAGTVHYANANGAFPTLPSVSESAELGEVDDGGTFVDGGAALARMQEASAAAEAAELEMSAGGPPPLPGRIKSERSLNLMPVVIEESEGALEDSTRRMSSSDVRSSGDNSAQPTPELSADGEAHTTSGTESDASGALSPGIDGSGSAERLREEAIGQIALQCGVRPRAAVERAGRGGGWVPGGGRRSFGEGRGRLIVGAQERAAEWLDSAALPSLCGRLGSVGEESTGHDPPSSSAVADPFNAARPASIGAASPPGPVTRGSTSGQSSGSAGQWETVRVADAMQAPTSATGNGGGMLGAMPLALMRERSATDISLGNFSEPWASGYTPSYAPSSADVTPCATVVGSEHGGREDAADTQELATVSPVAAPASPMVSTSNTAPNTMQLLTSYPYLAELSTAATGDHDGDAWLAHTSSSGAAAAVLTSRSDAAKFEAAVVRHARAQARAQSGRPPRSSSGGGLRRSLVAATAVMTESSDVADTLAAAGALSSFVDVAADKLGRHLDGQHIAVDSGMFSSSSSEAVSRGPTVRHMWDVSASAPLQMSVVDERGPQSCASQDSEGEVDAASEPLTGPRDSAAQGRGRSPASSPRLPPRRKGHNTQHADLVAELGRMLGAPTAEGYGARDTIARHAAAGAVVARAAFERARSASPLGSATRGRRAIAFANAPAGDADIRSAREMAREQAVCARSTRPRGVASRGRPAAVHSPSPESTARNRNSHSTPPSFPSMIGLRGFSRASSARPPIPPSPLSRSSSSTRPHTVIQSSLEDWATPSRTGTAAVLSHGSGEDTIATTSVSSVPLFRSPPSPSAAPTPSMSAFTGHLNPEADSFAGGGGLSLVAASPVVTSTSSGMADGGEAVTGNPSLSFNEIPRSIVRRTGDTSKTVLGGSTTFYTALEGVSRSQNTDRGSGQVSEMVTARSHVSDESSPTGSASIGSMPSSLSSPADVELQPDAAAAGVSAPDAVAELARADDPQQGAASSSPRSTSADAATDSSLHPPVTGEDSLFDLPHMRAMRDISLGGVSSTGPSDALHDSMTPTASVHGATLATWVHTSGRSSVSPPRSMHVPDSSITLPAVPASAAATLLTPAPVGGGALANAPSGDAPAADADGYVGPNPTGPEPSPVSGGSDAGTALPPQSVATGSGGSDALHSSTANVHDPGGHTASSAPGETYGNTASTAPGSWTSATSANAAEGPKAYRMPSGNAPGHASLDLASASVHSISHDAGDIGTSSLVLTASRSSGITVFRSIGAPAAAAAAAPARPSTAPDGSAAAVPRSGGSVGKPPPPASGGGPSRAASTSSPLPPLGPSQAAAKRLADAYSAGMSPLSPGSANTPTAASASTSTASPMIAAARMEDGSTGLRRESADSSTQVASQPLSGASAATSELTRDISPASSTPVVVEQMHDIAEDMQRQMHLWGLVQVQAQAADGRHDSALSPERGGPPSSGAHKLQDSARSGTSVSVSGGSRERRLLETSPDTSRGPCTTSNTGTPRPSTGEAESFGVLTSTPDGSGSSQQQPYRLFSRAWRGLVASSGSFRRSFSPKAASQADAVAAVTSGGASSLSAAGGGSSSAPRGDFTLVAARDLRTLCSSPSLTSDSARGVGTASGSVRTPSGRTLAGLASALPEVHHSRGDSCGSGLSTSALPAPIGEAGEQIGRVPHGGATETPWPELVAATVNAGAPPASASSYEAPYAVWKHASMGQMRLVVLARRDVMTLLGGANTSCVATGVAGVGSNKGAVAIACQVWGTELCFVNAHLAAHQSRSAERNKMFRTIARELRLRPTGEALLSSFHHVFFLGDLNYRLNYGGPLDYRDGSPGDALAARFQKDLRHAHDTGSYDALLAHDQLRAMQLCGKAFVDFHEADISYPPTFKVEREASIVYKPHRLPAWCDRILWHSNMPQGMHPLCSGYFMVAEADSSDHKPVGAVFTLPAVLSPAQVVSDSIENFVVTLSNLKAHELLERKMHSRVRKHVAKLRLRHFKIPTLRRGSCIRLRVHGDDFQQPAKASSSAAAATVDWKHELKLTCKHAYVEHIRGRMLRFKLSYETGHRRSRRTIAQGALPLMTVMPLPVHTAPHWPVIREEWPFSIPLYHGGVKAGTLTGKVRWSVRRNDPFVRLALGRVSRIARTSDS